MATTFRKTRSRRPSSRRSSAIPPVRDPIPAPVSEQPLLEADLFRSGSILIYCRASITLSLFVYAALAAMLYSDLYVHLIRQTTRSLIGSGGLPGFFLAALAVGCL